MATLPNESPVLGLRSTINPLSTEASSLNFEDRTLTRIAVLVAIGITPSISEARR
jgi:hypothetical protein